jgi:hypothetical protein
MVHKYSIQLEEGKIPDFHGEKKGLENFPYVGGKEEILRTIINIGKLKKVPKYSNQLKRGKIPDYNGEKEGPQIFPYVGRREEIMRTKKK